MVEKSRILSGEGGFETFARLVGLDAVEADRRRASLGGSFMPFACTEHYAKLIAAQREPYRTQLLNVVTPPAGGAPYRGRFDPYGNITYASGDHIFLQHKYVNTMLLHFVDVCLANCQFCYKVNEIRTENSSRGQTALKIAAALDYLDRNPVVNNVLFTGGDPAVVGAGALVSAIERLLAHPNVRVVRFATKAIAFDPRRFLEPELLALFERVNRMPNKQVVMINQINHPAELGEDAVEVLDRLRACGVQMRGQPAVVRGVNDDVDTLVDLQRRFLDHGIVAYYLTTFMPVRGVEQYGLTLEDVYERVSASKRQLNGLEKKGVLLASHDFGKFEIVGFERSHRRPERIVLKWHQAAMPQFLPARLKALVPTRPEDVLILGFVPGRMYCIDHVFAHNGLPYYDTEGQLQNATPVAWDPPEAAGAAWSPVPEPSRSQEFAV